LLGLPKTVYMKVQRAQLNRLSSKSVTYEGVYLLRAKLVLTPLVISVWSRVFLFRNRHPHLQPTLSPSPVVGPCISHRLHYIMGSPPPANVHRKLHHCRPEQRPILWGFWLLVLDHSHVPNRTVYHIVPSHAHVSHIILHPPYTRILSTTRQHQSIGWIQNRLPTASQSPTWQNDRWHIHHNR